MTLPHCPVLAAVPVLAVLACAPMDRGEQTPTYPLSSPAPAALSPTSHGTGFLVASAGMVLTARHVVEGCRRIEVFNRSTQTRAAVLAEARADDLALLAAPGLSGDVAAFPPPGTDATSGARPVFAAGYGQGGAGGAEGALANGFIPAGAVEPDAARFHFTSHATFGASGAPVTDLRGRVIGMVVARTVFGPGAAFAAARRSTPVIAVNGPRIQAFLAAHGIVPARSDEAVARSPLAPPAAGGGHTVGIHCWRHGLPRDGGA